MSGASKKLMGTTAAAGGFVAIEDVFSTDLFEGNGTSFDIVNGIDLAGEGGLVWRKARTNTENHHLIDTVRGAGQMLSSNTTSESFNIQGQPYNSVSSFNSDGFTQSLTQSVFQAPQVSWTFRKAPRFFDVVTYNTPSGSHSQVTVNHNLGVTPAVIIIKVSDSTGVWFVFHQNAGTFGRNYLRLDSAVAQQDAGSVVVTANEASFTMQSYLTDTGRSHVAYLFAHDPLGPSGDGSDGLIACGSYTTAANGTATIDVGWEPQWVLVKSSSNANDWHIYDSMRGWTNGGPDEYLRPNTADAAASYNYGHPTATGFYYDGGFASANYIYIAIRRGPMRQPESGAEVFAASSRVIAYPTYTSGFPVDFALTKRRVNSNDWNVGTRMLGATSLSTNTTSAEVSLAINTFDYMNGWNDDAFSDEFSWMFRRAPGFFDVVAYTGDGVAGRTVPHNLGVAPEMMIVKARNAPENWAVYVEALGPTKYLVLNGTGQAGTSAFWWNNTAPTSSVFTLAEADATNASGNTYIAYLFATLPGVSKVGSYTGNGTSQTIDCGFTTGARFVLIKRTDSIGSWNVYDTARGIVAGNDSELELNSTNPEDASADVIDPHPSGFALTGSRNVNGASYIFYAIA